MRANLSGRKNQILTAKILVTVFLFSLFSFTTGYTNEVNVTTAPSAKIQTISILEVQSGTVFDLSESYFSGIASNVSLKQVTMQEFIAQKEALNGLYDIVYIGDNEKLYTNIGTRPSKIHIKDPTNYIDNGASIVANDTDPDTKKTVITEYYSENDITNLRAKEVVEFINSGQQTFIANSAISNNKTKLYNNFNPFKINTPNNLRFFDSKPSAQTIISSYNSANKRPIIELYEWPNGSNEANQNSLFTGDSLDFRYGLNNLTNNPTGEVTVELYLDYNGDSLFNPKEMVESQTYFPGADYSISFPLTEDTVGFYEWKLVAIDINTKTKNIVKGSFIRSGANPRTIRVLQIAPPGNTLDLSKDIDPTLLERAGLFKIGIESVSIADFQNRYILDPNYTLNGKYDMVILGFKDSCDDITNQKALVDIKHFVETKQSIMLTHDTVSYFINKSTICKQGHNIANLFRDYIGMNRYLSDPMPAPIVPSATPTTNTTVGTGSMYNSELAAFSKGDISLSGGAIIDGNVGINSGAINMVGGVKINGALKKTIGATVTIPSWGVLSDFITGGTSNVEPQSISMPTFADFPTLTKRSSYVGSTTPSTTVNADGWYPSFEIKSNGSMNVDVGAEERKLRIDDFKINTGTMALKNASDKSRLFIYASKISAFSNVNLNVNGNYEQVVLYYTGTDPLTIASSVKMKAILVAPNASKITISGGASFSGQLITGAPNVEVSGGASGDPLRIYAPNANVKLIGGGTIKGSVVCNILTGSDGTTLKYVPMPATTLESVIAIPQTINFAMSYGITDGALARANDGSLPKTSSTLNVNSGTITSYPNLLSGKTLAVKETHYQWFQLDLEDPDVVVWYSLYDPNISRYAKNNPRNNYYTFSKGTVTFSGTGHSPMGDAGNAIDERRLFVNTMMKSSYGSNHAPSLSLKGISDNQSVTDEQGKLDFSFTVRDVDVEDSNVDCSVWINDVKYADYPNLANPTTQVVSIPKESFGAGTSFSVTVKAIDKFGAQGNKTVNINKGSPVENAGLEYQDSIFNTDEFASISPNQNVNINAKFKLKRAAKTVRIPLKSLETPVEENNNFEVNPSVNLTEVYFGDNSGITKKWDSVNKCIVITSDTTIPAGEYIIPVTFKINDKKGSKYTVYADGIYVTEPYSMEKIFNFESLKLYPSIKFGEPFDGIAFKYENSKLVGDMISLVSGYPVMIEFNFTLMRSIDSFKFHLSSDFSRGNYTILKTIKPVGSNQQINATTSTISSVDNKATLNVSAVDGKLLPGKYNIIVRFQVPDNDRSQGYIKVTQFDVSENGTGKIYDIYDITLYPGLRFVEAPDIK